MSYKNKIAKYLISHNAMTLITIHSNHFISLEYNLGSINDHPLTLQSPGVDFQNNEFNITPPAKLKVPVYVRPDPVEDIGDTLRFHWKDSVTGKNGVASLYIESPIAQATYPILKSLKKKWTLKEISTLGHTRISIGVVLNDPSYSFKYGFHICLANLHYRNVLTDFADQSFGNWKVTQSPVNEGYDPAQYGIKQFDTYGSQPYSLWIEWPPGKKYEAGSWVEIATEI